MNKGQKSETFALVANGSVSIGRDSTNAIRIDDPSVSRHHVSIHTLDENVEVEDLGSSNGTLLLRGRLASEEAAGQGTAHRLPPRRRVPLQAGDTLRVGPAVISLQAKGRASASLPDGAESSGPRVLIDREMKNAYDIITRAAASGVSVLLLGETGVGKEVMAHTLHHRSPRASAPFLLLNCATLPEALLESELFGHEKGAFTGAHMTKTGLLEATDGGTVFLDEVGELSLGTQAKLLRVLEERTLLRVGGTQSRRVDVRFVTATNRDLLREARTGTFRSDLYYRISGLVVRIPPLRERVIEIEPLARYFLSAFCSELDQVEPVLTRPATEKLQGHDWPGNVRELRNVIERAVLIAGQEPIRPEHVMLDTPAHSEGEALGDVTADGPTRVVMSPSPLQAFIDAERERVIKALEECGGNQTRAAKVLGISRRTLINRLEEWQLPRPKKTST